MKLRTKNSIVIPAATSLVLLFTYFVLVVPTNEYRVRIAWLLSAGPISDMTLLLPIACVFFLAGLLAVWSTNNLSATGTVHVILTTIAGLFMLADGWKYIPEFFWSTAVRLCATIAVFIGLVFLLYFIRQRSY